MDLFVCTQSYKKVLKYDWVFADPTILFSRTSSFILSPFRVVQSLTEVAIYKVSATEMAIFLLLRRLFELSEHLFPSFIINAKGFSGLVNNRLRLGMLQYLNPCPPTRPILKNDKSHAEDTKDGMLTPQVNDGTPIAPLPFLRESIKATVGGL